MSEYKIVFSEQAYVQMRDIALYLQKNVSSEYAAEIVDAIRTFSKSLAAFPSRCPLSRNTVLKRQGFHCGICCDKYLILYKINLEKSQVNIYAVVNGTRDYINLIF